ncbi:MAG TPA: TetR/AcrR family transcriptional regulator [Ignavibacteriaceae bacterium]|nr:TetR/AcrR family transcriptional regulator [Ignavibacteriaceae bacterium]
MPRTKEQFESLRQESRKKILEAALQVFAKEGYYSSTISAIANKAGISQGLMYNYFKSKEELLNELMIGLIENIMSEFMPLKPGEKIEQKDIIKIINATIDLVLEKPEFWKLYFSVFIQPDVMAMVMDKMMKMSEPYLKELVKYFKEKGEKDPVAMMRYFSAVLDGIQLHCMIDPETFPAEKVKKILIKQFG